MFTRGYLQKTTSILPPEFPGPHRKGVGATCCRQHLLHGHHIGVAIGDGIAPAEMAHLECGEKNAINHPVGNNLYQVFMVFWGWFIIVLPTLDDLPIEIDFKMI